jgi:DNA-binding NarL/FixJ family response regulator
MNNRTRILVADDFQIVRESLRMLLGRTPGVEVVGMAEDGQSAIEQSENLAPDLVLMDMELGDMSGVDASRRILAQSPDTRILMMSGAAEPDAVRDGIEAGIKGFFLKTNTITELFPAIRAVMTNKFYLSQATSELTNIQHQQDDLPHLSLQVA